MKYLRRGRTMVQNSRIKAASDSVENDRRVTKDNRLQFTEGLNAASIGTHSSLTQKGTKSLEGAK